MFRFNIIVSFNCILFFLIYLLMSNYSFCLALEINFIYLTFYLNFTTLWFLFMMGFIVYILLFLISKKIVSYNKTSLVILIFIFIFVDVCFLIVVDDFIFFMILFESLFFPICFVSLFYNFNNRFIFAIFYLIIFSSISSIICIIICIIILSHFNTLNLIFFSEICLFDSLYLGVFLWLLLFIMFAIKYPIWPFHIWLPELHVEVNTEMSALLASIVLKIGYFGVYKFLYLSLTELSVWFIGLIDCFLIVGLVFIAISLVFLSDYKKIIANWSVIHTGIALILLWHNDLIFVGLLTLANLAHIISSAFMFIIIGYMYDNYGVRIFLLLISFFGLSLWGFMFLIILLFNIDFPFMLLFYIDIFILYGLISLSYIYIIAFAIIILSVFVSSMYIYICLSYYSFLWLDKYLRLDVSINDIFIFFCMTTIILPLFFLISFFF